MSDDGKRKYFVSYELTFEDGTRETDNSFYTPDRPLFDIDEIRSLEENVKLMRNQMMKAGQLKITKVKAIAVCSLA